ncbi:MAG: hypothetical protein FRX48_09461 [Lasallia pustulata]|uniref:Protein trafficking Pga2 n=1 Tax=Lasallia pustulata TaxID=136370 RepID=A0A5M8PCS8_9LECA|nr:MAG: hypothetical protein FRX48_09461 [Lasallia pustulata]
MTTHPTLSQLQTYAHNFQTNINTSVSNLTLRDYIRLIIILGAYCLLRPYLLQLAARFQAVDHDRDLDEDEMSSAAAINPNSLRGQVSVPDDSSDENEEGEEGKGRENGTGVEWGKKARRRQRGLIRGILEAEEKLKREEEEADSDKEIEEFLMK